MRRIDRLRVAFAIILAMPSVLAMAQGIKDAMTGAGYPMSYAPKDLPEDYMAAEIAVNSGFDLFSSYAIFGFIGSPTGGDQDQGIKLYTAMKMTWTKGETVMMDGHAFLVTYKLDVDPVKLAAQRSIGSTGANDAAMTLHLIRTDSIIQIEPEPTYTKAKLLEAVGVKIGQETSSLRTRAISNMKQVSLAALMYAGDWDDVLPRVQSSKAAHAAIQPYHKNTEIVKTINPNGGQILFNMALSGVNLGIVERIAETPMFYDSKPWPDGTRIVGFAEGHVRAISKENWPQIEKALKWRFKRGKT